jgi:hypothetical protein
VDGLTERLPNDGGLDRIGTPITMNSSTASATPSTGLSRIGAAHFTMKTVSNKMEALVRLPASSGFLAAPFTSS